MTTTMAEPEWDEDTRNLVLGYAAMDICPLCHNPTWVCQSPEAQDAYAGGPPIRCHITTARLRAQRGVTEQTNPEMQALLWPVRRIVGGDG